MRMPSSVTFEISRRAAEIARTLAPKDTGAGAAALEPISDTGVVGIKAPGYMIVQNQGSEPRMMTELVGKTIPIRNSSGAISFRNATAGNIGRPRVVGRDDKGRIIGMKPLWQHPGIKATHFINRAINQATKEWIVGADSADIIRLLEESDVRILIQTIKETH